MKKLLFLFTIITAVSRSMDNEPTLGFTALHKVATPQKAKALIESGAEVNRKAAWRLTPLHMIALKYAKLSYLLTKLAVINQLEGNEHAAELKEMYKKAKKDYIETTYVLLTHQAHWHAKDKDGKMPIDLINNEEQQEFLDLLLKIATKKNNSELMTMLTPSHKLAKAMLANSLEKVQEILQADTRIYPELLNIPATVQIKKLVRIHYAFQLVTQDNWRALDTLIKSGLDVNAKKDGEPLLHQAVKKNKPEIIGLLLSYEADPCITDDKEQDTFLFVRDETTRKLLMDHFRLTPLVQAMEAGSLEKVKKLLSTTKINSHHVAINTTPEIKELIKKKESADLLCKLLKTCESDSSETVKQDRYLGNSHNLVEQMGDTYPTVNDLPGNL